MNASLKPMNASLKPMNASLKPMNASLKLLLLIPLFFLLSSSQLQLPSLLQVSQGYNIYYPIEKYFYNYQNITISEMTSYQNLKNYRLCFIGQQHKPYLQALSQSTILQHQTQLNQVLHNLNDVIKMDKILDTYFSYAHQTLYVISTKQLKVIEVVNNKINSIKNTTLNTSITQAQFIQANSSLIILTESTVLSIEQTPTQIKLKEMNNIQDQDQIYLNVFMYRNNVVYVTDDSINVVPNQQNNEGDQLNNYKKSFTQFQSDIDNAFFFTNQQTSQNLFFVFDQQHTFITFNVDLASNQSLNFSQFYKLPQANKCTRAHMWQAYLFLECRNHLIYIESHQIVKCKDQKDQNVHNCLKTVKLNHLNVGYHVKAIEFTTHNDVDILLIMGADKYETRYISVSPPDQSNPQNKQQPYTKIIAIPPLNTFYPSINLHKVYLMSLNTSLILSKNTLLIASQIPQKKQIFCKTVDENTHSLLDQPSGNFNGTLTVEGFCLDMVNEDSLIEIFNDNICRVTVQLIIKVNAEVQNYQFLWYILISGVTGIVAGMGVYCLIKKRSLIRQYNILENEKENGMQVLQQTMVTQPYQQESFQN